VGAGTLLRQIGNTGNKPPARILHLVVQKNVGLDTILHPFAFTQAVDRATLKLAWAPALKASPSKHCIYSDYKRTRRKRVFVAGGRP